MTKKELKNNIYTIKQASNSLIEITPALKKTVLLKLADELVANNEYIITANIKDIRQAQKNFKDASFVERLSLDKLKIKAIADSVKQIAVRKDIINEIIDQTKRPNGITIKKIRVPLGLIAIIYESRPNVTIDGFTLTFKSGNAVILKGGKEIKYTNQALIKIIQKVLVEFNIDCNIIKDLSGIDRDLTMELLQNTNIDCLIPRGGKNLIDFVKNNAKVPVIITGASVVHTYVDDNADLEMAKRIIINAKTRRVSICNALDVLLIHKNIYQELIKNLIKELADKKVEVRADKKSYAIFKKLKYPHLKYARLQDFDMEFLDYILAVKIVDNFAEALKHIRQHSLGHSEAIITKSKENAEKFFMFIDSACLYWNTSTQFSDGYEYGFGSEIGISTQKLHARGPFAYEALTTYKYIVISDGVIRK